MYQKNRPYPQRRGPAQNRDCTNSIADRLTISQRRQLAADRELLRRHLRAERLAGMGELGVFLHGLRDPSRDLVELAPRLPSAMARLLYVLSREVAA
jgi:hypothetical protein